MSSVQPDPNIYLTASSSSSSSSSSNTNRSATDNDPSAARERIINETGEYHNATRTEPLQRSENHNSILHKVCLITSTQPHTHTHTHTHQAAKCLYNVTDHRNHRHRCTVFLGFLRTFFVVKVNHETWNYKLYQL